MLSIRFRYIESFSRNYVLKQKQKNCNFKHLWNLYTNHFAKRCRPRTIKKLDRHRILNRLRQFYSGNRWMYETHFIHFSIFPSKTNQQRDTNFYRLKLFIIYIITIFLQRIDRLVWKLLALKKRKLVFVNNKRTVIARKCFFF